jgi:hypothetical protein
MNNAGAGVSRWTRSVCVASNNGMQATALRVAPDAHR